MLYTTHFLKDSLAIDLFYGDFILDVQITLLTNFKNNHEGQLITIIIRVSLNFLLWQIKTQYTLEIRSLFPLEFIDILKRGSTSILKEVFQTNGCFYDLINPRILASKLKSVIKNGIETISFNGLFKSNIKQIQSLPCRFKICGSFIANLGYIDQLFCAM